MESQGSRGKTRSNNEVTSTLEVRLFGNFELYVDGVSTNEPRAHKDRWLLALLLLANGKPLQRDRLATTLWPFPDFDTDRAGANLRRGLWLLRQTLGLQRWRIQSPTPDTLLFDLSDACIDVIQFDLAIAAGDHTSLEQAIQLHRAPLLSACTEAWIEPERERRERQRQQALDCFRATSPAPAVAVVTVSAPLVSLATEPDCGQQSEPEGGAVPLDSPFYVVRPTDAMFHAAISRRDSIVLVKGARETGKTSLLARGLQRVREAGFRVALTDFQQFTVAQMESPDRLFQTLAVTIADQLDLNLEPEASWNANRGWNVCFEKFLRRDILGHQETPLVWALDEVDRLFEFPYRAEAFALFRSWHNQRALNPTGPWGKFTLAIAYATEAHLFITDLNLSPFNVGTRLTLEDFTLAQVAELNDRYDAPLRDAREVERFYALTGGHPALTRRGLQEMAAHHRDIAGVEATADQENGIFGSHLRRMLHTLRRDAILLAAMKNLLHGEPLPDEESFYRLYSAGLIVGASSAEARPRCQLYQHYLERHLS